MRKKKQSVNISIVMLVIIIAVMAAFVCSSNYPFLNAEFDETKTKFKEADYVNAYCKGVVEYRLPDSTRIDCLTDEYAIEFDWAKKWAESIGQSLYYAKMTGKRPAVALIVKSPKDEKYVERVKKVDKDIMIFVIKSRDYQELPLSAKSAK